MVRKIRSITPELHVRVTVMAVLGALSMYGSAVYAECDPTSAACKPLAGGGIEIIGSYSLNAGVVMQTGPDYVGGAPNMRNYGVYLNGASAELTANNVTIQTSGPGQTGRNHGIVIYGSALGSGGGKAIIDGGNITTKGGYMSNGLAAYDEGEIHATNVNVTSTGYVVAAQDGGQVVLNGGTFRVVGTDTHDKEVHVAGFLTGGDYSDKGSIIRASNVTLIDEGQIAEGALAGNRHAMIVGGHYRNRDLPAPGGIYLSDSQVIAKGERRSIASISAAGVLEATNSQLTSELEAGIILHNNASLTLDNSTLIAGKESFKSVFGESGATQTIILENNSVVAENNGTLLRVDRNAAGSDGVVNMTLRTGAFADGNIENYLDGTRVTDTSLTNLVIESGAHWAGIVVDDTTEVVEEDKTITGETAGSVTNKPNTTVTFNDVSTINGSVSAVTNSTMEFKGTGITTITNDLKSQTGSTVQFQNSAAIQGKVTSVGSTMNFNGSSTTLGGGVATSNTTFTAQGATTIKPDATTGLAVNATDNSTLSFSQNQPTNIQGNVDLKGGSTIKGGSSSTPITITGNTVVQSNSTLGGNTVIQGALTANNATIAPGNSIGTLRVGSVASLTDTSYVAEIDAAGRSDLIVVETGTVDLSGFDLRVAQENGTGGYLLGNDYRIMQAEAGTFQNEFKTATLHANLADSLVKLDPVKYGAKDIKVSLSLDNVKVDTEANAQGWSSNQRSTMSGFRGNPLGYTVATMGASERFEALNQLSGEAHVSNQAALMNMGSLVSRTLSARMRGNLGAGLSNGLPIAQTGRSVPSGAMPQSNAYPLWAQVVGNWNKLSGNGNAAEAKTSVAGLFIGGDTKLGSGWRVGGALGLTDGKIDVDDRSSKSDVRSYTAAIYGGNSWVAANKNAVNLLAGASYTRHNIGSRRHVNVGGAQTLTADYHAYNGQIFADLGYAMPVGQASVVEPYAAVAWMNQRNKGFSESGGTAALTADSKTDDITTFTLGVRGTTAFTWSNGKRVAVKAGLGWRHANGDVTPERNMAFIQGAGTSFKVAGAPIAKNAAVLDLGAEASLGKNAALGLGYTGQFGGGNTDNIASLYLKVRF